MVPMAQWSTASVSISAAASVQFSSVQFSSVLFSSVLFCSMQATHPVAASPSTLSTASPKSFPHPFSLVASTCFFLMGGKGESPNGTAVHHTPSRAAGSVLGVGTEPAVAVSNALSVSSAAVPPPRSPRSVDLMSTRSFNRLAAFNSVNSVPALRCSVATEFIAANARLVSAVAGFQTLALALNKSSLTRNSLNAPNLACQRNTWARSACARSKLATHYHRAGKVA